jgi:hypothetical protein
VRHVRIDGNGNEKTVIVDTFTGITDDTAVAEVYTSTSGTTAANYPSFVGWTYGDVVTVAGVTKTSGNNQSGTWAPGTGKIVAGNPKLIITLYYAPNGYTFTLDAGTAWPTLPATWTDGTTGNKVDTDHATEYNATLPGATAADRPGYTLVGWTTDAAAATERAGQAAITYADGLGDLLLAPGSTYKLPANDGTPSRCMRCTSPSPIRRTWSSTTRWSRTPMAISSSRR